MICHLSLPAKDPVRVGRLIAKVIDGELMSFPIVKGAVVAVARDGSGTAIEVWPETTTQHPGTGEPNPDAPHTGKGGHPWDFQLKYDSPAAPELPVHVAVSSKMPVEELLALGRAEGWRSIATDRYAFKLVEVWLENRILLEIIPDKTEMPRYVHFSQPETAKAFFGPVPQ